MSSRLSFSVVGNDLKGRFIERLIAQCYAGPFLGLFFFFWFPLGAREGEGWHDVFVYCVKIILVLLKC